MVSFLDFATDQSIKNSTIFCSDPSFGLTELKFGAWFKF